MLNNDGKKGKYFHFISLSHLPCVLSVEVKKDTANQMCTVTELAVFSVLSYLACVAFMLYSVNKSFFVCPLDC